MAKNLPHLGVISHDLDNLAQNWVSFLLLSLTPRISYE